MFSKISDKHFGSFISLIIKYLQNISIFSPFFYAFMIDLFFFKGNSRDWSMLN
jgi:hypothetical protein